jgi:hypothetical protein
VSRGSSVPGVRSGFLETPRTGFLAFFSTRRRPRPSRPFPGLRRLASDAGQRLWMSITGSSSGAAWKNARSSCVCTSSPQSVGGPRAGDTGGGSSGSPRASRIFRIGPGSRAGCPQQPEVANSAKARDGFALAKPSERDQPDVAAAVRACQGKLLPHRAMSFAQAFARGVMRAWFLMFVTGVAAAFRTVPVTRSPACRGLLSLADVADGECRDGGP